MSLGITEADSVLKERYLPAVQEQLHNTNKLTEQIMRNEKDFQGRRAVLSLHHSRTTSKGSRAERGPIPAAGRQGYAEEHIPVFYHYGRLELTGPVIKTMKSDIGSFLRALSSEVKGLTNDVKRDYNRQLWGTGDGVIATAASATGQVITLNAATTNVQYRQLESDMLIDVGTVANPTLRGTALEITSVDRDANTVTVVGTVGVVAVTDFVFNHAAGGSGSSQKEVTGLQKIIDNQGTLFNIDPTVVTKWKSEVRDNSANANALRTPSDNLFEGILDDIGYESGNEPDQIWVSAAVKRAYNNNIKGSRRFENTLEIKGGYTETSITAGAGKEIALVDERDVPENQAFLLSTGELTHFVMQGWEFMSDDGAVLNRIANQDGYEATIYQYSEIGTGKRNAFGLLKDLAQA